MITHFVNSFLKQLTVSSVTISSSLENPIAKPSEQNDSFSLVSSFRPETILYIPGSSIELHYMCF